MSALSPTIAADIDRHHAAARAAATEAVNHAMEAGKLLLQVKASLGHGEWLSWLAANVKVSARQAQRYIAVAEGREVPIRQLRGARSNATPMSHLQKPTFVPEDGLAYGAHISGDGVREQAFFVEPSLAHPGHWFVTQFFLDDDDNVSSIERPVKSDWVELLLQRFGLQDPASTAWRVRPCGGVRIGLETVSTPEQVQQELEQLAASNRVAGFEARRHLAEIRGAA